jgi:hypothetical protein
VRPVIFPLHGHDELGRFLARRLDGEVGALAHRYGALSDIYSIPAASVHTAPSIAQWLGAGAARVVTCNTIPHRSNAIDIGDTIANAVLMHVDRPAGESG